MPRKKKEPEIESYGYSYDEVQYCGDKIRVSETIYLYGDIEEAIEKIRKVALKYEDCRITTESRRYDEGEDIVIQGWRVATTQELNTRDKWRQVEADKKTQREESEKNQYERLKKKYG